MKKIYYGKAVYNNKEINAVLKVLKQQELQLIDGKNVKNLDDKKRYIISHKIDCLSKIN